MVSDNLLKVWQDILYLINKDYAFLVDLVSNFFCLKIGSVFISFIILVSPHLKPDLAGIISAIAKQASKIESGDFQPVIVLENDAK